MFGWVNLNNDRGIVKDNQYLYLNWLFCSQVLALGWSHIHHCSLCRSDCHQMGRQGDFLFFCHQLGNKVIFCFFAILLAKLFFLFQTGLPSTVDSGRPLGGSTISSSATSEYIPFFTFDHFPFKTSDHFFILNIRAATLSWWRMATELWWTIRF